ncbi:MAG: hypothetical protein E6G41_10610 [Actinobacteria bacterium]|nr:MAG: hypothetical protein E6G41_10610 [Actinomycetota bacterium]
MITIEHLQVLFDAERQRDEVRFAELFWQHISCHDEQRDRAAAAEGHAECERSAGEARGGW